MRWKRPSASGRFVAAAGVLCIVLALTAVPPGLGPGWPSWLQILGSGFGVLLVGVGLASPSWRARLLLVAGSSALGLLLAEAVLQLTVADRFSTLLQLQTEYLFSYAPDATHDYHRMPVNGGETIRVHIDHAGFRGPELRRADDSTRRVVVFGDSFIAAEFSTVSHSYSGQLQRLLPAVLHAPVEVVNAGVPGYGPDQICLRLQGVIQRLKPDLLIVSIYSGNDYGDLLRNKLFRLRPHDELRPNSPTLAGSVRRKFFFARHGPIVLKLFKRAFDRLKWNLSGPKPGRAGSAEEDEAASMTAEWLRERDAEYEDYVVRGDNVVTNLLHDGYDADLAVAPRSPSAMYKARLMDQVIARIYSIAKRNGVPMLLLIIPSAEAAVVGYDYAVDSAGYPTYRRSILTSVLDSIAIQNEIPRLDLFDAFRSHHPSRLYFHGTNDHWNDAGQRLAAHLTTQAIGRDFCKQRSAAKWGGGRRPLCVNTRTAGPIGRTSHFL